MAADLKKFQFSQCKPDHEETVNKIVIKIMDTTLHNVYLQQLKKSLIENCLPTM